MSACIMPKIHLVLFVKLILQETVLYKKPNMSALSLVTRAL